MPLGVPIESWAKTAQPRQRVSAIADTAGTMAELHERGISHRDIKPANLVSFEERCHVVDFGLVNYPSKSPLTQSREQIGPRWTMAPEVRRNGKKADPKPADVYSLAKTLWILITGVHRGFDGQYNPESDLSIRELFPGVYTTPLESLLIAATSNESVDRPTMREFELQLRSWMEVSDDFLKCNPLQWQETLAKLFPYSMPERAVWYEAKEIARVLALLGKIGSLNHMFYPSGGGNDLRTARLSEHESGCIELLTGPCNLVKPVSLTFEGFQGNHEWNYFRLETGPLSPCGVYENDDEDRDRERSMRDDVAEEGFAEREVRARITERLRMYEEVTEINSDVYAERWCWDESHYNGGRLPEGARLVVRWLRGVFVLFQKTSFYNFASSPLDAYDGRHNGMTAAEFRSHIEELRNLVRVQGIDLRVSSRARRKPLRGPA